MKKKPLVDATREIMADPEFYAEIIRNGRAFDRGKGRAYDLDEVFGEKPPPVVRSRKVLSLRRRGAAN